MNKKKTILDFIKTQNLAVIATVDPLGKPEAAVIEFGETNNLELIFDAYDDSRKIQNIKKNNYTAFVIGWDEDITVQYEGEVFELIGEELVKYQKIYIAKNPVVTKWQKTKGIKFYKVVPYWIRFSDLSKH